MTKNLKISLAILITFIGIYMLNINSQSKLESTSETIFSKDTKNIYKFLIQQGNEAIELSKIDTIWTISGNDTLSIKSQSIDNLFNTVLKVNRGTIISENPNKYNKYSIDDSSGIHLAIINSKGETINYYVFGRSQSDYSRSYIRIGDDPTVYLADKNITYMLSTKPTYWGEKLEDKAMEIPTIPNSIQ